LRRCIPVRAQRDGKVLEHAGPLDRRGRDLEIADHAISEFVATASLPLNQVSSFIHFLMVAASLPVRAT
jgi:hypothetical protein